MVELEGHFITSLYFCLTFYYWVITVIVTAIFIGKMIKDLDVSRKEGRRLQDLKYKNDL